MWAAAAHVLALTVILAQPVASLAWLGGTHATPEQAALHEAAVEHGHYYHHGAPRHDVHYPGDGKTDTQFSQVKAGPEFTTAASHAAPFQDLLRATLAGAPKAPMPDDLLRYAPPAGGAPSQYSPPVPHRPPILLFSTFAFM
ncbi:MAG TPA: hypothetical protein VHM69_16915 [Rubrobacter sp.]|nr:hypothetical protein [Rubrobacter sp.]